MFQSSRLNNLITIIWIWWQASFKILVLQFYICVKFKIYVSLKLKNITNNYEMNTLNYLSLKSIRVINYEYNKMFEETLRDQKD